MRIAVLGTGRMARLRAPLLREHAEVLIAGADPERTASLPPAVAPSFVERFADAYRLELQDWVDSVAAGGPTGPSAWDGYAASAVADACLASLADGSPVEVRLAERHALYG